MGRAETGQIQARRQAAGCPQRRHNGTRAVRQSCQTGRQRDVCCLPGNNAVAVDWPRLAGAGAGAGADAAGAGGGQGDLMDEGVAEGR